LRKIIIDTDPGQDDALALMTAFGAKQELKVLGITCVAGNVPLNLTSTNALKICELSGVFDVPVFKGSAAPLKRKLITAEHVHGKTGLDGTELSVKRMKVEFLSAVDFIIESAEKYKDEKITICALGPLTNIAKVVTKNPKITESIEEIVLMGGGFFEGGNITPAAEFNIYVDPDAAKIVLESGVKITMLPLDVTHKTLVQRNFLEKLRNSGKNSAIQAAKLLDFFERYDVEKYGSQGGPLHDPNVIVYLLNPEIYQGKLVNVEIEINSELTRGMTVVDWWNVTDRRPNAFYINDVNENKFFEIVLNKVLSLEK
jgi:purine nucleosidase